MLVDDILARNRDWVRGREPAALPPVHPLRLAVVACYDPRLDSLLLPALGLAEGDAFLLRSAGALLQPGSTSMRSLALAMYMFGVTDVLVVGHVACRMAAFDTAAFIEEFRRRGVPREAFGEESLRTWAGAIPSPRQGVLQSVSAVREAAFVPKDVRVGGMVLDETTGALELVIRPEQEIAGAGHAGAASAPPSVVPPASAPPPGPPPRSPAPTTTRAGAAPPPPPAAPRKKGAGAATGNPRLSQTRALLAAANDFLTAIDAKEHWKRDVENLRRELGQRQDPRQRLELLDAFARRLGAESREVAESFARLRKEIAAAGHDPAAQLLSVFHHLGRRR
jgi:carbonic anhydrase